MTFLLIVGGLFLMIPLIESMIMTPEQKKQRRIEWIVDRWLKDIELYYPGFYEGRGEPNHPKARIFEFPEEDYELYRVAFYELDRIQLSPRPGYDSTHAVTRNGVSVPLRAVKSS